MSLLKKFIKVVESVEEETEQKFKANQDTLRDSNINNLDLDVMLRELLTQRENRRNDHSDYTHGSALVDFCPREAYFKKQEALELSNFNPTTSDQIIWFFGKQIELFIKDRLIELDTEGTGIYGAWKNKETGDITIGTVPDPANKKNYQYEEIDLVDSEYKIASHPDLYRFNSEGKLVVIEIKSVTRDKYREICTTELPIAKHKKQGFVYHKLSKEVIEKNSHDIEIADYIEVLYVCREYLPWGKNTINNNNSFKMFKIPVAKEADNFTTESFYDVALYNRAVKLKRPPKKKICSSPTCERAKDCPVVSRCFS